jgi:hypothetical protein
MYSYTALFLLFRFFCFALSPLGCLQLSLLHQLMNLFNLLLSSWYDLSLLCLCMFSSCFPSWVCGVYWYLHHTIREGSTCPRGVSVWDLLRRGGCCALVSLPSWATSSAALALRCLSSMHPGPRVASRLSCLDPPAQSHGPMCWSVLVVLPFQRCYSFAMWLPPQHSTFWFRISTCDLFLMTVALSCSVFLDPSSPVEFAGGAAVLPRASLPAEYFRF